MRKRNYYCTHSGRLATLCYAVKDYLLACEQACSSWAAQAVFGVFDFGDHEPALEAVSLKPTSWRTTTTSCVEAEQEFGCRAKQIDM